MLIISENPWKLITKIGGLGRDKDKVRERQVQLDKIAVWIYQFAGSK